MSPHHLAVVALCALLAACGLPGQPTQSAFSRNVGFGSAVEGQATSAMGTPASGNDEIPGVTTGNGVGGNSQ